MPNGGAKYFKGIILKKICSKCEINKDVNDFAFKNKSKNIRQPQCRECRSSKNYSEEYKQSRKDYRQTEKYKQKRKENGDKYITLSDSKCLSCGEKIFYNKYRQKGLFCDTQCSANYKTDQYITKWLAGEIDGLTNAKATNTSSYIKTYMKKNYKHCEICGLDKWNNLPIPLEMDHIDGNALNNNRTNLRMICPNCHNQTDNYGAKNFGKSTRVLYYKTIK